MPGPEETTTLSKAQLNTEPVKLELPLSGKIVTLRAFPPANMTIATRAVFLRHTSFDPNEVGDLKPGEKPTEAQGQKAVKSEKIPAEAITEINKITAQHMMIDFDGSSERPLERLLDECPYDDYNAVIEKCNEIDKATSISKKK